MVAIAALTLAAEAHAAPVGAGVPAEGLVKVESRNCSEVYARPGTAPASYRQVVIDIGTVSFRDGWLRNMNDGRDVSRWITPKDEQRIAADFQTWMRNTLTTVFEAKGYLVVHIAGPDTLELKTRVVDLYVNDVYRVSMSPRMTITREAGQATLMLETRDGATGALLLQSVDHRTAMRGRVSSTTAVSNRDDFSWMIEEWAVACMGDFIKGSKRAQAIE
jgi:hypothetical protein